MTGFPESGKIIVSAPETAVRILDASPASEHHRIYTMPGMNPAVAIVIDLDKVKYDADEASKLQYLNRMKKLGFEL